MKTFRFSSLLTTFLAASLLVVACSLALAQGAATTFRPYQNSRLGFQLEFPSSWQVTSEESDYVAIMPPQGSPQSGEVAVEIVVSQYQGTLDQAITDALPGIGQGFAAFQEIQRGDIVVSGLPAKVVLVKAQDQQGNDITMNLVFVLSGRRGYILFLETLTGKADLHQAALNQVLASFTLADQPLPPQSGPPSPLPPQSGPPPLGPLPPQSGPPPLGPQPPQSGPPPLGPQPPQPGPPPLGPSSVTGQPQPSGMYGAIELGGSREGTLAASSQDSVVFHSYTVEVPAGLRELTVTVDGLGSDVDLAVKWGSEITSYSQESGDADYQDFSQEPNPSYSVENPQAGTLFIDVVNLLDAPASYRITVTGSSAPQPPSPQPPSPGPSQPISLTLSASPYENGEQGYRVGIPQGWQAVNDERYGSEIVTLEPPSEAPSDLVASIIVDKPYNSLEDFVGNELSYERDNFRDVQVLQQTATTVSGVPGQVLVTRFILPDQGLDITETKLLLQDDVRSYMLTLGTRTSVNAAYQGIIERMLESFALLAQRPPRPQPPQSQPPQSQPQPPSPGPQPCNPLAPCPEPADPFVGTFIGDTFTLELQGEAGEYRGNLHFQEQVFPVTARLEGETLTGTFESAGAPFAFTATLQGGTLTFETGGATYALEKQEQPVNPLGR